MEARDEFEIRQRLKDDFVHYASRCLIIRDKEANLSPLILNRAQLHINHTAYKQKLATGRVRIIVVKGRQQGCSTLIGGRYYWLTTHHKGVRVFILTHDIDATNNLFEMVNRYHDNCPLPVKPQTKASNAKELIFGQLDSGYKLGTAGNKSVGRSSTIQLFHGSEVAMWPHADEHAKGILQTIPNAPGTEIFLESTGRGVGNYFHEQWQMAEAGEGQFLPVFTPWFWQTEYYEKPPKELNLDDEEKELITLYNLNHGQIYWRRLKIAEFKTKGIAGDAFFKQEYPCTPVEAFQAATEDIFIAPDIVATCRKRSYDRVGNLIIGLDIARFGDDRTSIIRRRGRVAYDLESHRKKDTMQVVGIMYRIIQDEEPSKVCVDIGGIGAGVYDRLCELLGDHKHILVDVNSGATPINQKVYFNKRAEMWGEMRAWLVAGAQVPDSDSLHADLCGIKYKINSSDRIVLEKKSEMKRRGIRSPDEGDTLALTFALPFTAINAVSAQQYQNVAKSMMQGYNRTDRARMAAYKR